MSKNQWESISRIQVVAALNQKGFDRGEVRIALRDAYSTGSSQVETSDFIASIVIQGPGDDGSGEFDVKISPVQSQPVVTTLSVLRHHVSGAIERGEATSIEAVEAPLTRDQLRSQGLLDDDDQRAADAESDAINAEADRRAADEVVETVSASRAARILIAADLANFDSADHVLCVLARSLALLPLPGRNGQSFTLQYADQGCWRYTTRSI